MLYEERTTSKWYDDLREGTLQALLEEVECVLKFSDHYKTWQISAICGLLTINPTENSQELRSSLLSIIETRNEAERHEKAKNAVATKADKRKRLLEARSCLVRDYRVLFQHDNIDYISNRLISDCGNFALQWWNEKTTVGIVTLEKMEMLQQNQRYAA